VTDLLLDTTFLVDAERAGHDLDNLIADEDDVAATAFTIAEPRVGVELATRATRPGREPLVDSVITSIPVIDYIAATARATGRVVLTADAAAFSDLPDVAVRSHLAIEPAEADGAVRCGRLSSSDVSTRVRRR
jgi:predicted nucleic acid-binding protein